MLNQCPSSGISALVRHGCRLPKLAASSRHGAHSQVPSLRKRASTAEWTPEELELVTEMRSQRKTFDEILTALQDKSLPSLSYQLHQKNKHHFESLQRSTHSAWSETELGLLRRMLNERKNVSEIVAALPGRTRSMINYAVKSGKLNGNVTGKASPELWLAEELAVLEQMMRDGKPVKEIAGSLPNKTLMQVRSRLDQGPEKLRQKYPKIKRYTGREDSLLLEMKGRGAEWPEIQAAFPSRNLKSLRNRLNYLRDVQGRQDAQQIDPIRNNKDWTVAEDNLLLYLWNIQEPSRQIIADVLERSKAGIADRITVLQDPGDRLNRWMGHVVNRISRDEAREISAFISTELARPGAVGLEGASPDEIYAKFNELALPKLPERHSRLYNSQEDETIVRMRTEGCSWSDIHQALPGRTLAGLKFRWAALRQKGSGDAVDGAADED